jgi:Flp pilus assembly pilin Flp
MLNNILALVQLLKADRKGIASLEWAVLAAFIVLGLAAALPTLVSTMNTLWTSIEGKI